MIRKNTSCPSCGQTTLQDRANCTRCGSDGDPLSQGAVLRRTKEKLSEMALQMEDILSDRGTYDPDDELADIETDVQALVAQIQETLWKTL